MGLGSLVVDLEEAFGLELPSVGSQDDVTLGVVDSLVEEFSGFFLVYNGDLLHLRVLQVQLVQLLLFTVQLLLEVEHLGLEVLH